MAVDRDTTERELGLLRRAIAWELLGARERSGMTQAEAASAAGIGWGTMGALENAKGNPRLSTVVAAAAAHGMRVKVTLEPMEGPAGEDKE